MKLKRIMQILLIGCCVVAISACTTNRRGCGSTACCGPTMADNSSVEATGIGESENFGGSDSGAGKARLARNGNTYYFDYDSNVIHEEDKPAIIAKANYLLSHPHEKIILEGHTDPRGSREYNIALGERRANAVNELLRSKGINPHQIRVVSYGAERLAMEGRSEEAYRFDRRAIIVKTQG